MPVYEYYCESCNLEFELIRPVSKIDDPAPCATCKQNGQRQLSNFSFKSKTFSAPKLGQPGLITGPKPLTQLTFRKNGHRLLRQGLRSGIGFACLIFCGSPSFGTRYARAM